MLNSHFLSVTLIELTLSIFFKLFLSNLQWKLIFFLCQILIWVILLEDLSVSEYTFLVKVSEYTFMGFYVIFPLILPYS